jgi:hypothetical protein
MACGEPDVLCMPAAPTRSLARGEQRDRLPMVQAVGRLLWHFAAGEALSTMDAARLTGYSRRGASNLLTLLSTYWPICQDEHHLWYLEGTFAEP